MDIEIHCQGCGKLIHAPRETAGKWATCPACGRQLYVPTPSSDLEELPLAPEDTAFLKREADLQAERHRIDRVLNRERGAASGESRRPIPAEPAADRAEIEKAAVQYLRAMAQSDFARAEQILPLLQRNRGEVMRLLDRLTGDQMPPQALANVPPGVFHGFLKHLRSQLGS